MVRLHPLDSSHIPDRLHSLDSSHISFRLHVDSSSHSPLDIPNSLAI